MQDEPGLTENERAELNRLRAEIAALRAHGQAAPQPPQPPRPGGRQRWRTIVAVLLIVLGCVLAPLAGVAVWARNQVTNSDRYVATITPLASDPAIQQAITDQITAQVFTAIDIQALTTQVVDALSAREAAEDRYRQAEREAQAAAEPRRLVQRAAVNAYRRGQLSVTELNRIWQHLDAGPPEPAPPVHQARSQYELAVAEAEHVRRETHVTTVVADVLAEEAEIAESHLSAALRTADPGLALLRAG